MGKGLDDKPKRVAKKPKKGLGKPEHGKAPAKPTSTPHIVDRQGKDVPPPRNKNLQQSPKRKKPKK